MEGARLPKGVRKTNNGKFHADVSVDNVKKWGTVRDTVAEADADAARLFAEQKAANAKKREEKDVDRAAKRAAHAEELEANNATSGGNCELDGLSRDLLKLALADSPIAAADNVEYCKVDASVYERASDMGFDPKADYELDPGVPTFSIQLKAARSLQKKNGGRTDNPQLGFKDVNHYNHQGLLVVMLYIPPEVTAPVTRDDLDKVRFWYEYGTKLAGGAIDKAYTLHGGSNPALRARPGRLLRDTIEREFRNQQKCNSLVPYGDRSRLFEDVNGKHAKGQAAIDAFRKQVLNPLGALLLPTEDGREGGAADVRIHFAGGAPLTAQVKHVRFVAGQTGFQVSLHRHAGGYRDAAGKTKRTYKPYKVGENDCYVFVRLDDDDKLAEYWLATDEQMVGDPDDITKWLIADAHGNGGVLTTCVHPRLADKARLGDTHLNNPNRDDGAVRTRQWVRSIGRIAPPDEANALADRLLADKRALHASTTAARVAALEARVEEVAAEAGPSTVINNNITINNNNNYHAPVVQVSGNAAGKRALGSLDGWVKRLRE
jgi:hypothetical protein